MTEQDGGTLPGDSYVPEGSTTPLTSIKSLSIKGELIELHEIGITVIVGGNNVGKSTLLREIESYISQDYGQRIEEQVLLDYLELRKPSEVHVVIDWLERNATRRDGAQPGYVNPLTNHTLNPDYVDVQLKSQGLGQLSGFLIQSSRPTERREATLPAAQRDGLEDAPTHPIHALLDRNDILEQVNSIFYRVFRQRLELDRLSGKARLRVGTVDIAAPPVNAVTHEYTTAIAKLANLHEQGDGMISLMGIILSIITSPKPIFLLDEPEAFLHPPQAYELGVILSELARQRGMQIILATHESNLLAGLLDAPEEVSVVRLDRDGGNGSAAHLPAEAIKVLWEDPTLRYLGILDGLFHRLVVLAEAYVDCKFYSAALDSLNESSDLSISPSEVLFIPTGGKDGMKKIAPILKRARVRVVASPDLDILSESSKLAALVEAFDGDWGKIADKHRLAIEPLRARPKAPLVQDVRDRIDRILSEASREELTVDLSRELSAAIRLPRQRLNDLKTAGTEAFRDGARRHAMDTLEYLDSIGIFCVRVGELERFDPTSHAKKGMEWLTSALENGAQRRPEPRDHIGRMLKYVPRAMAASSTRPASTAEQSSTSGIKDLD